MNQGNQWWYADKDKKHGPVTETELQRLLQQGKISTKTLVWAEGNDNWEALGEVEALQGLIPMVPPPIPPKPPLDPLTLPMANRWPRFFARIFDVWWELMLVSFAVAWVLGRTSPGFVEWIQKPQSNTLYGLMCLPAAFLLDAVIYRLFGNTPGKAILGLRVSSFRAEALSFNRYFKRNMGVWGNGLAVGFPLLNLFAMASQSRRIGRGAPASYDVATADCVRASPAGWFRKSMFATLFLGLLVTMGVLMQSQKSEEVKYLEATTKPPYEWLNPITQHSVTIDNRWALVAPPAPNNGGVVQMFSEASDHAVVVLGVETVPSVNIQQYAKAYAKSNSGTIVLDDEGNFIENATQPTWIVSGHAVADSNNRFLMTVYQIDDKFWRISSIQVLPYEYSKPLVEDMYKTLRASF